MSEAESKGLVTLVNPNFVRPGVTPYALDILTTHLEAAGFDVDVIDLTFRQDDWGFDEYFATHAPLLVGITLRNAGSVQPQEQRVFLPDHKRVIDGVRAHTKAPIVLGGVGFSTMPYAALEYYDAPFGVKGPGEIILCRLAAALADGTLPEAIEGLFLWDGRDVRIGGSGAHPAAGATLGTSMNTVYRRRSGLRNRVNNFEYYQRGGLGNILTKSGCPFACNHCVEPDAKGHGVAVRTVASVVDEMESLVAQGVHDLHTTDSEFNVKLSAAKDVLREIGARRRAGGVLRDLRLWIYAHPKPFDEELADLLVEAGCRGVSISAEHICREDLAVWEPPYGRVGLVYTIADVERLTDWCTDRGIVTTTELLFGLPGENAETLKRAVDASLRLRATVIGYTLGFQVFPHAPLGYRMAAESGGARIVPGLQSNTARGPIFLRTLEQCATPAQYERQFWFDEDGNSRPVFYFSPDLPEDPQTVLDPAGRRNKTIQWFHDYVPPTEHYRIALPTIAGDGGDDNNYADNPFLMRAAALGRKGAYYSWWRDRDAINAEALARGIAV